MKYKIILGIVIGFLFFSCTKTKSKVEVSYDNSQSGFLLIDKQQKVKLPKDSVSITISIEEGEHIFKLNNEKEFTCRISGDGILNLNNDTFVSISEVYENDDYPEYTQIMNKPSVLVIDSLVYIYTRDSLRNVSDTYVKTIIGQQNNTHDMKFYGSNCFIQKDWDYGLSQDFPDVLKSSDVMVYKNKVMPLRMFELLVLMHPEYFEVRKLEDVLSNKADIQEDRTKSAEQLEMD